MNRILINILSWLLHHANRGGNNQHFYEIKNKILTKHGIITCFDVQFIEGKKCRACHGTGIHEYYDDDGEVYGCDFCWHCHNGWYKRPTYNILAKFEFGKYTFHQPFKRVYEKPESTNNIIEGFISHNYSKYTDISLFILFLIYEKGFITRYLKEAGKAWRVRWWLPRNWANNLIHLIKYNINSIPVHRIAYRIKTLKIKKVKHTQSVMVYDCECDDLPF